MVEKKKKSVLKAAEYLFATKGFSETTVADISKESGVNEPSIYAYFNNKRNILFKIQGKYLENAIKELNEHFQGMKEPGPKLRKAIWHYLSDMMNHPHYARTLMMAQRENPEFYSSEYAKYIKEYSAMILRIVIKGQEENFFRRDLSPRLIRNLAMGTSVYTAFHSIVSETPYDPNEMSDVIYQLVVDAAAATEHAGGKDNKIHRNERTEIRKAQIINSAVKVFARRGFSNATISEIAGEANLGEATLYEYFDNKEGILFGSAEVYLRELISDADQRLEGGASNAEDELRRLIWHWIWLLYTREDFARVLVLDLFRNLNFYGSPGYQHIVAFWEKIRATVEEGQRENVFREDIPFPPYLYMIMGTLDQFLLSQFLLQRPPLGIRDLTQMVETFLRAARKRSADG